MKRFNAFLSWIKYYVKAKTIYQIHSPLVYEMMQFILDDERHYYVFDLIERERTSLLTDSTPIKRTDFGAGSDDQNNQISTISKIAKRSLSKPWQCRVMFRLAEFLEAQDILELGTSLGISTLYLAGNQNRQVTALEGDPELSKITSQLAHKLSFQNLHLYTGPFSESIPLVLDLGNTFDLIFMDGHHLYQPTIDYFSQIEMMTKEHTVVIIDDIHWSSGMQKAWKYIQQLKVVTQTIDLYYFGIVFFKKSFLEKQHHVIIPVKHKPWKR